MSLDMNVAVDVRRIQLALDELGTVTRDRAIPRVMAAALLSSTEQAFERQADPDTGKGWEAWSDSWQAWRQDHGFVPGSILTLHGDLARSITTDYGQDYALIGSPKFMLPFISGAVHPIWHPARQAFLRVLIWGWIRPGNRKFLMPSENASAPL